MALHDRGCGAVRKEECGEDRMQQPAMDDWK
jgi:hypothetical protein